MILITPCALGSFFKFLVTSLELCYNNNYNDNKSIYYYAISMGSWHFT